MKKILTFPIDTKLLYLLFSYLFVKQIIQKRVVFDQLMRLKPEKQSKLATNSNSPSEKHSLERFLWGNADCQDKRINLLIYAIQGISKRCLFFTIFSGSLFCKEIRISIRLSWRTMLKISENVPYTIQ